MRSRIDQRAALCIKLLRDAHPWGTTVVNTATVTFANAITQVGMPQANLIAQLLGLVGATADSYDRVSVNTPALMVNNAGAGIEATVNKAAAGNDAAFAFKSGSSARALIGQLGYDDFSFKVSPDGSAFFAAVRIDRTNGQVELPQPTIPRGGLSAAPSALPSGKAAVYARNRAGAPWIDVMRPSCRDLSPALPGRLRRPRHVGIKPERQRTTALERLVVLGPVQGLVGRSVWSAHPPQRSRWIHKMNPPRDLCNRAPTMP